MLAISNLVKVDYKQLSFRRCIMRPYYVKKKPNSLILM